MDVRSCGPQQGEEFFRNSGDGVQDWGNALLVILFMKLNYIVAAESAFFSDDQRVSIIKIFNGFSIQKNNTLETSLQLLPPFTIVGRVDDDYGEGLRFSVVSESKEELVKEIIINADEKGKEDFTFVINLPALNIKESGDYFALVKDFEGKKIISNNIKIFTIKLS